MTPSDRTNAELLAERDFLLDRLDHDSSWIGQSSTAMTRCAIEGRPIPTFEYPHDWADYDRCVRTRDRAPQHLQGVMDHWLKVWWPMLEEHYSRAQWDAYLERAHAS